MKEEIDIHPSHARGKEAVHQIKCLITAVLAGLLLYAATSLRQVSQQIEQAENTVHLLQDTEQNLVRDILELQSDINDGEFHRSAERIARDKLGMVKPGERIFYSVAN